MKIINYNTFGEGAGVKKSTTPCPFKQKMVSKYILRVGSIGCVGCKYHATRNKRNQTVHCTFVEVKE